MTTQPSDNDDPFLAAMSEVAPLNAGNTRVTPKRPQLKARELIRKRSEQAAHAAPAKQPQPGQHHEPWTLRASGVSAVVVRRLAAGQPPVAMTLDLHGMHCEPALQHLQSSILAACQQGKRVLRVIHGRGMHSPDKPVLKQAVYHDLQYGVCASHVLAAIPEPGSMGGACLVLLRRERS